MGPAAAKRLLLVGLGFLSACGEPESPPIGRPPVMLVVFDALDAGHVSHLGYERDTTPVLDSLAAQGVTFTRALAPAPYTLASVPSLLTGLHPVAHRVTGKGHKLAAERETLAELLAGAGYTTYAAVGNPSGSSLFGLEQGFDVYVETFRPEAERARHEVESTLDDYFADERGVRERMRFHYARAEDHPPLVEAWVDGLQADETPFFYLHFLQPHSPYDPPEPYRSRYLDPDYDGPFGAGDNDTLLAAAKGEIEVREADIEAVVALYDANLAWVDSVLGRVLELLRERDLLDELLIVVTSDHGEAFWQHGRWGHNTQLYEEMVRVPLIVRFPQGRGPSGLRVEELASLVDVVPSLCDWLDLRGTPTAIEGRPLAPLVAGGEWLDPRELLLRTSGDHPTFGLTSRHRKAILERDRDTGTVGRLLSYDLRGDPGERHSDASVDERVEAVLRRVSGLAAPVGAERALEPGVEEALRALGYVDD